jgi:predicted AlkP superfamily phosphohydrolase/phosphomutase
MYYTNTNEGYTNEVEINLNKIVSRTSKTGDHTSEGLFIAFGNGIAMNKEIKDMESIDVLPTILWYIGYPLPDDLDGKVIKNIWS